MLNSINSIINGVESIRMRGLNMHLANIFYILFAALIIWGMKPQKPGQWNDEVMSFDHTKAFLGFSSVGIILHHCAEATCAEWLPRNKIVPGMEGFVCIGYLFVAAFFFCSGYGMYKAGKKEDFAKKFFPKRIVPILIPTAATWAVFVILRAIRKMPFKGDPVMWHPHIWFVPVLIVLYIAFFIGFGLIKKDIAGILIVGTVTAGLTVFLIKRGFGSWWYNTNHLFFIGILMSKFEKPLMKVFKKLYVLFLILAAALTVVGFAAGNYWAQVCKLIHYRYDYGKSYNFCVAAQMVSAVTFAWLILLIGMKIKIGNPALRFLGRMTLDLYMIQAIFVYLFDFYFIEYNVKPFFYIKDVTLFTVVVLATSIVTAFLFHLATKPLVNKLRGVKKT